MISSRLWPYYNILDSSNFPQSTIPLATSPTSSQPSLQEYLSQPLGSVLFSLQTSQWEVISITPLLVSQILTPQSFPMPPVRSISINLCEHEPPTLYKSLQQSSMSSTYQSTVIYSVQLNSSKHSSKLCLNGKKEKNGLRPRARTANSFDLARKIRLICL